MSNKGYMGKDEAFAGGGPALGRTKDFMKEPDRFREGRFTPKPEASDEAWGKGASAATVKGKDKSLSPVKPQS